MHLATYLGLLHEAERSLASSYRQVGHGHAAEADIAHTTTLVAGQCDAHVAALAPVVERYGAHRETEPERLHADALADTRSGGVGLLRDLHDLYMLCAFVDVTWTMVGQAAQGLRDRELLDVVSRCESETATQLAWLTTRMKQAAPQALIVAS
ncbi:MAG TPA: hypothetical protein VGD72_11180 [Mycobacteriales bacterium]|jgi:hypothetical protein